MLGCAGSVSGLWAVCIGGNYNAISGGRLCGVKNINIVTVDYF